MRFFFILTLVLSLVAAVPLAGRTPTIDDHYILQFALTLEHLENAFYQSGLAKFDNQAFADAGLPDWVLGRVKQIAQHESIHVNYLEAALEASGPVKPCEYSFPFTDPVSFLALSEALESTGDAAYLGAVTSIESKSVLAVAASVNGMEGRHASWVKSAVQKHEPWSGAFETSLGPQQVFTLASQFITSCPTDNFDLGLTPFPALTFDVATPTPGQTTKLTFNTTNVTDEKHGDLFLAFLTGIQPIIVPMKDGTATVPNGLQGTVYVVVTNSATDVSDASTIAGPTVLLYPFDSKASNTPAM